MNTTDDLLAGAARAIRDADALLITAGAGMGVDSGLPDFRGTDGFWQAYPAFARLGLRFEQLASPAWFARDPHLAWGFYGHRLNLYRRTTPHDGFGVLLGWARAKPAGFFVFTSNVDGQFQTAGVPADRMAECHGSIHHLQCAGPCHHDVWTAEGVTVHVDDVTMRAADPLPACGRCGGAARPNVLMFGDGRWRAGRTAAQLARYERWLRERPGESRVVIVECGAGSAVPTVRLQSQHIAARPGATLVRINVREADVAEGGIGIAMPAADALRRIDQLLRA